MYKTAPCLNFNSDVLQQYLILLLQRKGLVLVNDTFLYSNTFHDYAYITSLNYYLTCMIHSKKN